MDQTYKDLSLEKRELVDQEESEVEELRFEDDYRPNHGGPSKEELYYDFSRDETMIPQELLVDFDHE